MIDYNIIATGSTGNAVVINSAILIDCGVPFKALKDVYKDLKLVLLTHCHSDHFNFTTIKKLAQERPTLRWGVPVHLVADMLALVERKNIDVCSIGEYYHYGSIDFAVSPFELMHNVPNCGWKIFFNEPSSDYVSRMIYATDTNSLERIIAKDYDLYMIEANYTEQEIIERIRQKQAAGEYCHEWDALQNHLSKEKADNWLYQNMSANSQYIYMHQHKGVCSALAECESRRR